MTWWEYVQRHTQGLSNAEIARTIGVTPSSVGRWESGGVDPHKAALFARAFGRPVLEAFIAAGFLTPQEAGARVDIPYEVDLSGFSEDELLDELRSRIEALKSDTKEHYDLVADDGYGYSHEDEDELREMEP